MQGQNVVRKAERDPNGKLQVQDVWYTIQGEGPFSGHPAVFIRLTGCNLRCWFCDTHWDDEHDPYMPVESIVATVEEKMPDHCQLVVITGGEPMRQYLAPLITRLLANDPTRVVQIETAGTLWQYDLVPFLMDRLYLVVCPKTPTVHEQFYDPAYTDNIAFKYVIRAGDTFPPTMSTQIKGATLLDKTLAPPSDETLVFLSPCDEGDGRGDNARHVAKLALEHGHVAGIQLHKILSVP